MGRWGAGGVGEKGTNNSMRLQGQGSMILPGKISEFILKEANPNMIPIDYNLFSAYPNPFNPSTKITFSIPESGINNITTLNVYDLNGNLLETISKDYLIAGTHEVMWIAEGYSSGIYFISLESGNFYDTIKLMLIK